MSWCVDQGAVRSGVVRGIYVEGTCKHTNAAAGNKVLFWIFPTQVNSAPFSSPSMPSVLLLSVASGQRGVLMGGQGQERASSNQLIINIYSTVSAVEVL